MGEGIKDITERVRKEREQGLAKNTTLLPESQPNSSPLTDAAPEPTREDLNNLIAQITSVKVSGQTKMVIRFDDKHIPVLNMLQPALKINVVQFVNYLVESFFETNPDTKTLMKNRVKNSLKDI
ncbi:MAG: hypothetical protein AAGC65_08000 [Mucilaginibacter sp.]|uniref:hypothetical protein n=1 Tax=Mucilaginibacter sp. TaxID=1882438 RepID=UPI0031A34E2D